MVYYIFNNYDNDFINLPYNITRIQINKEINNVINLSCYEYLIDIEFNRDYLCDDTPYFPKKLEILTIKALFLCDLNNLPNSLIFIDIGNCNGFNGNYDFLPVNLTHLFIDINFNNNIDNLPISLNYLKLGIYFIKLVNNLPHSLLNLTFGYYFNNNIDDLPNLLKYITFNSSGIFNKSLNNLPDSLIYITLPNKYNLFIDKLPKCIIKIYCSKYYKYKEHHLIFNELN